VTRRNIILIKKYTNMGGSKNVKETNEKNVFYQKTKVQKLGTLENERVEKP